VTVEAGAAEVVRRFYDAMARRDLDTAGSCFGENAVWILLGRSAVAGEYRGWASIRDDFLARLDPISGGTLEVRLVDVAIGESYVVAVQHATAEHEGKSLDVIGVQLMRIEAGEIVEVRGHYSDQYALDRFWS